MVQKLSEKQYFIIDFDSTFTQVEGLDELASIALANQPNREAAPWGNDATYPILRHGARSPLAHNCAPRLARRYGRR